MSVGTCVQIMELSENTTGQLYSQLLFMASWKNNLESL